MIDNSLLESVARRGSKPREQQQLARLDWLQCALQLFVNEGIDALRITRLADELNVTRGSFYWHFDNREDLVEALVTFWQAKNTTGICEPFDQADSLDSGILSYFAATIEGARFDPRLDLAIREWARRDTRIRQLVDSEDRTRIDSIRRFFQRFGNPMPDALIRARVLYYSQIGFYALEDRETLGVRLSHTAAWYRCLTGEDLDTNTVQDFRREMLQQFGGAG